MSVHKSKLLSLKEQLIEEERLLKLELKVVSKEKDKAAKKEKGRSN